MFVSSYLRILRFLCSSADLQSVILHLLSHDSRAGQVARHWELEVSENA